MGDYALSRDIEINGFLEPIFIRGPIQKAFCGNFDGNGFTISNTIISQENETDVGLFDFIGDHSWSDLTRIENLRLHNISVIGKMRVGVLAGTVIYVIFTL